MTKLPYTISAGYADEWIIGFQSADYIKMDDEERAAYKQQLAQAMSVRYNTLRGMDTERLVNAPVVRSLLYIAYEMFNTYLTEEGGQMANEYDARVDDFQWLLGYMLGQHDDEKAIEHWEKKEKEMQNNANDE